MKEIKFEIPETLYTQLRVYGNQHSFSKRLLTAEVARLNNMVPEAINLVEQVYKCTPGWQFKQYRGIDCVIPRQLAMYIFVVIIGMIEEGAAEYFKMKPSNIYHGKQKCLDSLEFHDSRITPCVKKINEYYALKAIDEKAKYYEKAR